MIAYTVNEIAMQYFPYSTSRSASNQLRKWIDIHSTLKNELLNNGWTNGCRFLTPKQVKLIYYYLGEPG